MSEYTYKDIIIDPMSEEAKNCIGKMVYFSDNIRMCLCRANKDIKGFTRILQEIKENEYHPFKVNDNYYQVIIPIKEEQKPESEYVQFESISEFLEAYEDSTYSISCDSVEHKLLSRGGIWLKQEYADSFDYYNVTEICDKLGLAIGSDTAVTSWNALLKNYKFLDGTPCGKIKE